MEMSLDLTTHHSAFPIEPPPQPAPQEEIVTTILAALAYADLFDYPLTLDEMARYQVGTNFSGEQIRAALAGDPTLKARVGTTAGYFHLKGRQEVVGLRREREQHSRKVWRRAIRYSRLVSRLPYVRMVAVTGALAVHNIGALPDIDLLVVTRDGRVWICRRALIACVRVARLLGDDLCPNYVICESNLELDQRDFFTAHELAQMVPMSGLPVYGRMLRANNWANRYLPSALKERTTPEKQPRRNVLRSAVEALLGHRLFDRWERWELRRLQAKLKPLLGEAAEVVCSPTQCKGHTGLHRQRVMSRYRQRLEEVGLGALPEVLRLDLDPLFAVDPEPDVKAVGRGR